MFHPTFFVVVMIVVVKLKINNILKINMKRKAFMTYFILRKTLNI